MGRRPDPEHIRALKGKTPRIPPDQQITFPVVKTLTSPEYFTDRATHHWERMTLILSMAGLLQEVGRDKLGRYCQACADYEEIMLERKKMGRTRRVTVNPGTYTKMAYMARMMKHHVEEMQDFEKEYGLTPSSAARIRKPGAALGPKSEREKFEDFLEELPRG
jgi:P27 family predicted phage terminase small subunit